MSLEIKKKQVELQRVISARMDLELRIEERLEEIERIKTHIEVQTKREHELMEELKNV